MTQFLPTKSTDLQGVSSHLVNPLNTPSGPNTVDYFTTHRGRHIGLQSTNAIHGHGNAQSSVESIKGSLLDLPNEIIAHILELGFFEYDADHSPDYEFRTLASQISGKLHDLVLQTPSLWSVIHLSFSNIIPELEFLPVSLRRSMEYPLTVRLSCYWDALTTEDVMDALLPHIARWEHFSLTATNDHILTLLEHHQAPFLEYLSISFYGNGFRVATPPQLFSGCLPRLKYLCLRHVDIDSLNFSLRGLHTLEIRGYGQWPTYSRLNEMLGGSPNLQDLTLHVGSAHVLTSVFPGQIEYASLPQVLLPELRRMTVHTSEWMTWGIAALVRVFSCPKLERLTVRACYDASALEPQNIMIYTMPMPHAHASQDHSCPVVSQPTAERFSHRLFLHTCNFYAGCKAAPRADLTTLELHRVQWPTYPKLKEIFTDLKNLTNLLIYNLNSKRAILSILGGHEEDGDQCLSISDFSDVQDSITLPHLECLTIEFNRTTSQAQDSNKFYTAGLLRIFSLPVLKSLHLKNVVDASQWNALVDIFAARPDKPSGLMALTLTNMTDNIPTDPWHSAYTDLAAAFPRLRSLALEGVGSANAFIRQLLPPPPPTNAFSTGFSEQDIPLSDLQHLSLCDTPHASKPFLHRVIAARGAAGRPLRTLVVDKFFTTNLESLTWLREHVEEVEVRCEPTLER